MHADEVLSLLDLVETQTPAVWVDGGWGIDALVGHQTREHADLDLVVDDTALEQVIRLLTNQGFRVLRDWRPTAIAFAHADGRELDLHPVALTTDGGGDQVQRDGSRWHYDPPVSGQIAGRPVRCCSVATQLAAHLGYEPDDHDFADMRVLAAHFECDLPPPYGDASGRR